MSDLRFKAVENTDEGKYARTLYHCIACYGNYSLIRVRLKTGRTHQIRVHMKFLGCPILGDSIYNKTDSQFPHATLMLHSQKLKIKLPNEENFTVFKTKTPKRFLETQKKLKAKYKSIIPKKDKRIKIITNKKNIPKKRGLVSKKLSIKK